MQQYWDQQFGFASPAALLLPSPNFNFQKLENDEQQPSQQLALKSLRSLQAGTKPSSRNDKKKLAGQKSREKKKNYVKTLEQRVKELASEIEVYDSEILKCKDQLVDALKSSHNNSNEHAYTFTELEKNILSEDPDLDRINLLIDVIRNRIGASGTERCANLSYNFKQIVNSMFPAIYRYLFNTAELSQDLFAENMEGRGKEGTWIAQLYANLRIEDERLDKFRELRQQFCQRRMEAVKHTKQLKAAKQKIKKQGQIFENWLGVFRKQMTPLQCAIMTLFAQKNKLRREFVLITDFEVTEQPQKRVKIE